MTIPEGWIWIAVGIVGAGNPDFFRVIPPVTVYRREGDAKGASPDVMKETPLTNEDRELRELLRRSRAKPPLPPGFDDGVWRRLAVQDRLAAGRAFPAWLDAAVEWALRPRLALAGITALVMAGALWGTVDGLHTAKLQARGRYLSAVAPAAVR